MLKYLIYVWDDILRNKVKYIIFFIQMLVILYVCNFAIQHLKQWNDFKSHIDQLGDKKETIYYGLCEDIDAINENTLYSFEESILQQTNGQAFSFLVSQIKLADFQVDKKYASSSVLGINCYNALYITNYIQEFYNWNTIKGRLFNNNDIDLKQKYIPVLLGHQYRNYYEIDEIIDGKYIIVGVLDENAYYLNPKWAGEVYSLKDSIIIPMTKQTLPWKGLFLNQLYLSADDTILEEIINNAKEIGVNIKFRDLQSQILMIQDDTNLLVVIYTIIVFSILILSTVSIMAMLSQMILARKKEFAIHVMCGASLIDIYIRIILQVFLVIFASFIVMLCLIRDFENINILIILSIVIVQIIIIKPFIVIQKQKLSDIIKRSE